MSYIFLDTSALLKLYLSEKGSSWIKGYLVGQKVGISELALFESATVLARRYLRGEYTRDEAKALITRITQNCIRDYIVVPLDLNQLQNRVFELGTALPSSSIVRTLDTIQLAVANLMLEEVKRQTPLESFVLVAADVQLLKMAQAQGFVVENPENYP